MLDAETKRKIDSARDILVGKVPDPKAQVEQITTALIYKFMDDMDREAEELGGKATFLTGELQIYQWANLMSKELGGEARLNLYMSALLAFSKTPNIPEIFRTIFKDAFLPYRDPETLNLFLKQIDWFDYDHSENLGDAFEYLLSVLGSQGDAGQFRTPRHIIDFIVEVIEPKKTDTILDPSCGTAGFLISAYKHILANNTTLTPSEKKQLVQHFTGYDISPDMVRLSLVNLYLHSFPTPKVYEYDTLTSEDRWQENFDVILANPPFMTPKGGIRPHNRFSVQAKRSEVLFVDYIAEHLNLNGRAGIIVPEGIIFQSANAYKALRKMLVDNHFLWAVVSLPAGVFQPYSGVKTSILLLDRAIAKQREDVLFIKIASDGYDLGAQRRENTTSDLPTALGILKAHRRGEAVDNPFAQVVAKAKIAETGDYNLTGDRYRETKERGSLVYPLVKLEYVCIIERGASPRPIDNYVTTESDGVNWIKIGDTKNSDKYITQTAEKITLDGALKSRKVLVGDFVLSNSMSFGRPYILKIDGYIHDGWLRLSIDNSKISHDFMYYVLNSELVKSQFEKFATGGVVRNLNSEIVRKTEIPLPPLEIQNAIVAEIEQWQKVIDGAKQVVANYRPTIEIKPEWEIVTIKDIASNEKNSLKAGPFGSSLKKDCYVKAGYKIYGQEQVIKGDANYGDYYIDENKYKELNSCKVQANDILISLVGTYGKILVLPENCQEGVINPRLIKVTLDKQKMLANFFVFMFQSDFIQHQLNNACYGGTMSILSLSVLKNIKVPLPPLEIQNAIVEQIEQERTAVESCKTLIALFETKIKNKIAQVWGE